MAKSNMLFYRFYVVTLLLWHGANISSQGNCLLYKEGSKERQACELSHRVAEYRQGSRESQDLLDQVIKLNPNYAWAYYEKSVPFFKRGLLSEGLWLINKAIELEPNKYLYYRAYWYFYNRSYDNCIKDLEELYTIYNPTYRSTPGGELEMRLLLGISYTYKNNPAKGIKWVQDLMEDYKEQPHLKGLYDHYCLGILYFNNQQYDLAKTEFEKQTSVDDNFADTYYYLGLISQKREENGVAKRFFQIALEKMNGLTGGYSTNLFTEMNIYKKDIELALRQL